MCRFNVHCVLFIAAACAIATNISGQPLTVGALVQNHQGLPVAGAQVALLPLANNFEWSRRLLEEGRVESDPVSHTTTDATGRFQLVAPAPGVFTVLVEAPGYVPVRHYPLALANPAELPTAILLPDERTQVSLHSASHSPAAGIWVMAMPAQPTFWRHAAGEGWREAARIAQSDANGLLTLPRAAREKLEVVAFPPGQSPIRQRGVEQQVTIDLPANTATLRTLLVHDEDAQPLVGIVVSAGRLSWPVGRTDSNGRLQGVPVGVGMRLHLFAPDGRRLSFEGSPRDAASSEIEILFPRPVHLVERVLHAQTREPVVGALVWAGHDPGSFTITDSRGRYQLLDPGADRFWVQAEAEAFLPRLLNLERRSGEPPKAPVFALEPAAQIAGQVLDEDNRPLAGVRMEAHITPAAARPKAFRLTQDDGRSLSDAAGRFFLDGLSGDEEYEVTARKPGYAPTRASVKTAAASLSTPPQPLRLVLQAARTARGQVLDAAEQPLAGVEIAVFSSPPGGSDPRNAAPPPDASRARSDATGRFTLAALPGSPVDIRATKRGFTALDVHRVKIPAGEGPADLGTFIMIPGATLTGRVHGPEDEPLDRAEVWITEDVGQPHVTEELLRRAEPAARTGKQGTFLIEGLQPQRKLHLLIHREGYLPHTVLGMRIPQEEALNIELGSAARLHGRVIDPNGSGIAGAQVSVRGRELPPGTVDVRPGPVKESLVETDATGHFEILDLTPGEATLEASARGFQPSKLQPLDIPAGDSLEDLVVELEPGVLLEGQITNTAGEPVAGARILLERQAGQSNTQGSYQIDGVALGPQLLTVWHRGYERVERTVEMQAGENLADFVLKGGWSITGRVVDETTAPIPAVDVRLKRRGRGDLHEYRVTSDADGHFTIPEAVAGSYDLEASKSGYVPTELPAACELVDRSITDLEVELQRGATLSGEILGLSFEELAVVQVEAERGERRQPGTVDYSGHFEIADLGPGDWQVRARLTGGSRQTQTRVSIEPGTSHLTHDLEFTGGLTLRGQVVYGNEPLPGTQVTARSFERAVRRSVVSDHEGTFLLADLKPGKYRLALVNARQLVTHYEDVEVLEDRDVIFQIATAVVRGRVISSTNEQGLSNTLVSFQKMLGAAADEPGPLLTVGTGAEGTFTVTRVSAGSHRLRVQQTGFAPHERRVEVAAGEELDLTIELDPSTGLDLQVRLAQGRPPEHATVHVYETSSGRFIHSDSRFLSADGVAHFETIPAGSWDLLVTAPGGQATRIATTVPGPPVDVVLPPATRLEVRVPALVAANKMAILTLQTPEGQAFQSIEPGGVRQSSWHLIAGVGTVESVPAGVWTVKAVDAEGQTWQGTVATSGEGRVAVRLE